ncbi:MAG TPA: NUDIX domain-containing protein [Actinomycetes bacterium]|nr:NUDIX domain-containing protein [Actinomycetes bacterium]
MSALVIFTDVRGFTKWSEANEVFVNLDRFVTGLLQILRRRFPEPQYKLKPLGDGALLVSELQSDLTPREVTKVLDGVLAAIQRAEKDFTRHCQSFSRQVGHSADLRLGWGIVRGKVIRVDGDWTGHNLNKCSRLCGQARPFGIVIDQYDFPELPRSARDLSSQRLRLEGIGEVSVWVSKEIASQFLPRELLRETPEVHVAGTCITEDDQGRISLLVARRSPERRLYPGKLEGCGGQLRYSETFAEGVRRHFLQEMNLDVEVLEQFHDLYEIREPNEPVIPGIRFLCRKVGSGQPHSTNHSELKWVTEGQFRRTPAGDFVGNLKREVLQLLENYKRTTSSAE